MPTAAHRCFTRTARSARWAQRFTAAGLLAAALVLAGGAHADDVPAEAVVADLPFLAVPGSPRIHLDLAAAGQAPFPVVLDTGFAYPLAAPPALRRLGPTRPDSQARAVIRGSVLGDVRVRKSEIFTPEAQEHSWVHFGGEELRPYIVDIDFEKRRVRFIDRTRFALPDVTKSPAEGATSAVFELADMASRPYMEIEVNGRKTLVAVDTSVTLPVSIGPRSLAQAAVHPKTLPILRPRGPAGATTRLFETDTVRVGPFAFGVVPVYIAAQGPFDALGPNNQAIGLDLLSQFRVRLDITGRKLWLERRARTPIGFYGNDYAHTRQSGLFLGPLNDDWLVLGVLPGSPAERAGILPDDRIGRDANGFVDPSDAQRAVRTHRPVRVKRLLDTGIVEFTLQASPEPGPSVGATSSADGGA